MNKFSGLAILGIFLTLLLGACGGSSPTAQPQATTAATAADSPRPTQNNPTATTVPANPAVTSTPVVLPSVTLRPTSTPAPTTASVTRPVTTGTAATGQVTAFPTSPTNTPVPLPPAKPVPPGLGGKLSVVGNDFALYVNKLDGKAPQLLLGIPGQKSGTISDGQILYFPTWSPAGDKLAVISADLKAGSIVNGDVVIMNADGTNSFKVLSGSATNGIYLSWSPDGKFLTALVSGSTTLELYLVEVGQTQPVVRKVLEGQPLYTGWASDSDNLYIHTNNNSGDILARAKAKDAKFAPVAVNPANANPTPTVGTPSTTPQTTAAKLGFFRAPAFSSDGARVAYSIAGATRLDFERIVIADVNGNEQNQIPTDGNSAAFSWSPASGQALLAHTVEGTTRGLLEGLYLTDLSGAAAGSKVTAKKVVNDRIVAFFWSPDGKKIAYVGFNADATRLTWNIYDLTINKSTKLLEWLPSREQLQVLTYFDQYGQSDSVWSPDSKSLVFSGYDELELAKNSNSSTSSVYIAPVEGADAGFTYLVGPGALSFWTK